MSILFCSGRCSCTVFLGKTTCTGVSLQVQSGHVWSNPAMEKASYMNMQFLLLKESVFSHLFNICMEMASVMDLLSYFATGDYNNCCIHTTHTKQKTCTVFLSNFSINLLAFCHECRSVIGYATHYLFKLFQEATSRYFPRPGTMCLSADERYHIT